VPTTSESSRLPKRNRRVPAGAFVVLGLAFIGGVTLAGVFGYLDRMYSKQTAAYDAAAVCSSATEIADCRFQGEATIVRKANHTDSSGSFSVDVSFSQLGGKTVTGDLDTAYQLQWQSWQQGATVNAELWQGLLTKVGSVPTLSNPDLLPNAGSVPVVVFGGGAAAMVVAFVWLVSLNRRAAVQI
jgi:hypothetical protein